MAISIKEALSLIQNHIKKIGYEIVPIENSVNRIIACDVKAKFSMPRFNNSAMDGYGVKLSDSG